MLLLIFDAVLIMLMYHAFFDFYRDERKLFRLHFLTLSLSKDKSIARKDNEAFPEANCTGRRCLEECMGTFCSEVIEINENDAVD